MKKATGILIGVGILVLVSIIFLFLSFKIVRPGTVGVVTHFGAVQSGILPEGMHMVVPGKTKIISLDVRIQKLEAKATASSKDLQPVTSVVALNFYLSKEKANIIYRDLGLDYANTIIQPTIQESIKSATARFNAEELITQRPKVKEMVYEYIKARLAKNNIIVTDFSIIDFNFSEEFNNAIEKKQIAEQQALTAKNDLERIKTEAEQAITRAEGEAEAQKLLQQGLDDKVLQLRFLEKWDGRLPVSTGGDSYMDVSKFLPKK